MATITTAARDSRWVEVPQISSGNPRSTARAIVQAPASAVRAHRPVRSAQHGPAMRSPIRMMCPPRIASVAAMSKLTASARYQSRLIRGRPSCRAGGDLWLRWMVGGSSGRVCRSGARGVVPRRSLGSIRGRTEGSEEPCLDRAGAGCAASARCGDGAAGAVGGGLVGSGSAGIAEASMLVAASSMPNCLPWSA